MYSRFFAALCLFAHSAVAVNNFYGITISSFRSDGPCRNADDWNSVVALAKANGYKRFRIYGNDCGTTYEYATAAAQSNGLPILIGVWVDGTIASSSASIDSQISAFVAVVGKYGAGNIDGVTIGNEVNDVPSNIMQRVRDVRTHLNGLGYAGPISTVHNWVQVMNNPVFCDADRVTINAHAFYDGNVLAENADNFIRDTVLPNIQRVCAPYAAVNNIVITESGWPSRGASNGDAVPSVANEGAAIRSLNCAATTTKIFTLEADDSVWKSGNENERSFGILGKVDSNASDC